MKNLKVKTKNKENQVYCEVCKCYISATGATAEQLLTLLEQTGSHKHGGK